MKNFEKNLVVAVVAFSFLGAGSVEAAKSNRGSSGNSDQKETAANRCDQVISRAEKGCELEASADYNFARAKCLNLPSAEIKSCVQEAHMARGEATQHCEDVDAAREALCAADVLGNGGYHVEIDPANFLSPEEIAASPHKFFPLIPGSVYKYDEGDGQVITVTVTSDTREIMGVNTVVVSDTVEKGDILVEDTLDYYAQDKEGNVWYFGESVKNFDEEGRLLNLDGSWVAGVDGAEPGIKMPASPQVGKVYRQEFLLNEAEDIVKILKLNGNEKTPAIDCKSTCLMTEDTTPLEPDALEHKYFYPGVGFILTIHPNDNNSRTALISYTPGSQ